MEGMADYVDTVSSSVSCCSILLEIKVSGGHYHLLQNVEARGFTAWLHSTQH